MPPDNVHFPSMIVYITFPAGPLVCCAVQWQHDLCHVCGCVHLLLGWPRFWVGKLMMCEQRGRQKESCSRVLFTRVFSKKTTQWLTWLSELLFVTTSSNLRWQPREISQLEIFIYDHSDDTWTHPQSTAGDLTFRPSLWRQWLSVYLHLVWTHT